MGDPDKAEMRFKLYDCTVSAIEAVLGKGQVEIGTHAMAQRPSLWDPLLLLDHCKFDKNYMTGQTGTMIDF